VKTKLLGFISLFCLVGTVLWLVLLIWGTASAGPTETFEQVLAHVAKLGTVFYLTYVNAALITIGATMLFAGMYVFCRPLSSEWSAIAVVFVPVYSVLNLFAYLSQVLIVPRLLALHQMTEYQAISEFLLGQLIQQWPSSSVYVFNNLAYAVLGIPSIIFGAILFKQDPGKRLAGSLMALNGVACIMGMVGIALGNRLLGAGSLVGGVLFLFALGALSWAFLGGE
jgi:hypothetical protein